VVQQASLWFQHLPTVTPHYAIKCNNDQRLLTWLFKEGVRFDCASPTEMLQAFRAGASPSHIVYAHPCKSTADIQKANRLHVPTTVVDSPEEVDKLVEGGWAGGALIRLMVPDSGSLQPFSKKFGAPVPWVRSIAERLAAARIPHHGWSFHVGSLCTKPAQFSQAIELCAAAQDLVRSPGPMTVDIGGGFVSEPDAFAAAAAEIRGAIRHFPADTRWIAEPGRFFATPVVRLEVQVIGAKKRNDMSGWRYTVDESLYGAFSNIPFDGQRPVFKLVGDDERPKVRATLFGRTCDSADCLAEDIELPELRTGDWLSVDDMGAYTLVSSSEFNGFPLARREYITV
jgi:ornithine decarboxylase